MARDIYGNYDEEQVKTNTTEEEVYYEDDLEKNIYIKRLNLQLM